MKKKSVYLSILFILIMSIHSNISAQDIQPERAGIRSSSYGFSDFPDETWWYNATLDMSKRFAGSSPAVIWILGYTSNNGCYLNFPNPTPGTSYSKIYFSNSDENEAYLDSFDNNGTKVWLQVEPGFANVSTLIDLVLTKYGHHPSIIGFGVDVEWYQTSSSNNNEGKAITDAEAQEWSTKIKSYNQNYLLFTKHWLIEKMPPTFRTDIVFLDDSQMFSSLNEMVNEFVLWSKNFMPAKVGFQYGYDGDKKWWSKFSNPPLEIGKAILNKCTNVADLFWVDFTAYDIWPEDFVVSVKEKEEIPGSFMLYPNYPNPFNPSTLVCFNLAAEGTVDLSVYNSLGQKIKTILDGMYLPAGKYKEKIDLTGSASGIYYVTLRQGSNRQLQKIVLLK